MALAITANKSTFRAGSDWVDGDTIFPIFTATGNTGVVNWSDGGAGGTFYLISNNSAGYFPRNVSQTVVITGADTGAGGSGQTTVQIYGTFPLQPNRGGMETLLDQETKLRRARGGTRYFREDYQQEVALTLTFERRENAEMDALFDFFKFHRKIVPFYYYDVESGLLNLVRFESGINRRFDGQCSWTMSCNVRGDFQNAVAPPAPPTELLINCGSNSADSNYRADLYYLSGEQFFFGNDVVIDTSGLTAPFPPASVLRWCRYHPTAFGYLIENLKPLQNYTVTMYLAGNTERSFLISAQGATFEDVVVPAGYVAIESAGIVQADASGEIEFDFALTVGVNALVNAIKIVED